MQKILLFSNEKELFEIIQKTISEKYEIVWCRYDENLEKEFDNIDIMIMHFTEEEIQKKAFEFIIAIKAKLGNKIPILAVIEGGTIQDIFAILKIGVYDYIRKNDSLKKYREKIEEVILWSWYIKIKTKKTK